MLVGYARLPPVMNPAGGLSRANITAADPFSNWQARRRGALRRPLRAAHIERVVTAWPSRPRAKIIAVTVAAISEMRARRFRLTGASRAGHTVKFPSRFRN